jgi:hypothetical protein
LPNAYDGNLSTTASGVDNLASESPATATFSGIPAAPFGATVLTLNVNMATFLGGAAGGTWTVKYSINGGSSYSAFPGIPTSGATAQTTYTLALSSSQDLTLVSVQATEAATGTGSGAATLAMHEIWVAATPGSTVTVAEDQRTDPMLCNAACLANGLANGQTVILSGAVTSPPAPQWNGTFPITGTNNNWVADGTGGHNVIYTDNINNPGTATYCNNDSNGVPPNPPQCNGLGFTTTWASLGYKMTDIAAPPNNPDDVYAFDTCAGTNCSKGGDTTCTSVLGKTPFSDRFHYSRFVH